LRGFLLLLLLLLRWICCLPLPPHLNLEFYSLLLACLRMPLPLKLQRPAVRPVCDFREHSVPVVRVAQSGQRGRRQRQPQEGRWGQLPLVSEVVDAKGGGCAAAAQTPDQQGLQLPQGALVCPVVFCICRVWYVGKYRPCPCCGCTARPSCGCRRLAGAGSQHASMLWPLHGGSADAVLHAQQQQRCRPVVRNIEDGLRCLLGYWGLQQRQRLFCFTQRPRLLL
jgi:hypothetical protein